MTRGVTVVVIGGGVTGCGVARDLAMRGLEVTLVERDSLNAGTSGRSHGVLHSGARYADADPESARACLEESRILRRIAGRSIEDTGGYFLQLPADDGRYFERKLAACRELGMDPTVLDGAALRDREPDVASGVTRAIAVPDAVVYPSRLVAATAASAREHDATIRTGVTVTRIDPADARGRVAVELDATDPTQPGNTASDRDRDLDHNRIVADHVVNAAGPWAGRVAALAGIDLRMAPTRGLMIALAHAGVDAVLNRCRPPADGDIVVPHPETVVCGTTSVPVGDPDNAHGTRSEVESVRAECAAMVPALAEARAVETYWGVRPLFDQGGRRATRGYHVLDHAERDGVFGLTTVVGGKLTTYRRMAEAVSDHVVAKLGVDEPCRTAGDALPGHEDPDRLDQFVAEFGAAAPADRDIVDP